MNADLDVIVIGGGIQGLLALDALQGVGYSTMLVTAGPLGDGQTIHSHGFLNTGFGMLGADPLRASEDRVQPFLRARGVDPTGEWRVILPPGFPSAAPPAPLAAGFDEALSAAALASPDRNVPKQPLIESLARGRRDSIVQGRAVLGARSNDARSVVVHASGGEVIRVAARAVVAAAGCGTTTLLEALVGRTPQLAQINYRRVHMICVRAQHGVLPAVSVVAMPIGLMLVAHDDGSTVTWYVTPMEFGGPAFDDVPRDASSVEDPATLARGLHALRHLYPALSDAGDVVIGAYAGYREDVGDMPGVPLCEPLTGAEDVIVALPSGLVPAWTNAERVVALVGGLTSPSGERPAIARAEPDVAIALPVEDRTGFAWLSVDDFARRVGADQTASSSSAT
ncbi:MAG: FAD-dependent oxidoreductase [Candidatus Dormibacteria bacterium]